MRLSDRFDEALATADDAIQADGSPARLITALSDFVLLHDYRAGVAASDARLARSIERLYTRAALVLPQLRLTADDKVLEVVDHLQTLARVATTFDAVPLECLFLGGYVARLLTWMLLPPSTQRTAEPETRR